MSAIGWENGCALCGFDDHINKKVIIAYGEMSFIVTDALYYAYKHAANTKKNQIELNILKIITRKRRGSLVLI